MRLSTLFRRPAVIAVLLGATFCTRPALAQTTKAAPPAAKLTVAVLDLDATTAGNPALGKQIAEALTAMLSAEDGFTMVDRASLVIAHNASFDRRFLERLSDAFVLKPWACSMSQVDWIEEGHEGVKLAYLAAGAGFFYDRHRAVHDCRAAIELLATPLPTSGVPAMQRLLQKARRPSWRIWAENSPFDLKDVLKARGYRWNGEANGLPRAWWKDIGEAELEGEKSFLRSEVYRSDKAIRTAKITAQNRYSRRIIPCA